MLKDYREKGYPRFLKNAGYVLYGHTKHPFWVMYDIFSYQDQFCENLDHLINDTQKYTEVYKNSMLYLTVVA